MNAHEKNMTKTLLVETNQKINRLGVCWSVRLHSQTPPFKLAQKVQETVAFFVATNMPQLWADSLGVIPANFLSIFFLWGDSWWFPWCDSICDIRFWFLRKVTGGCTYRTENKHVWWTKYDKLLHVQRQGQNITKPTRSWLVTKINMLDILSINRHAMDQVVLQPCWFCGVDLSSFKHEMVSWSHPLKWIVAIYH